MYIDDRRLVEAVVGRGSPAVGMRPDAGFRAAYGGVVVAVHRHGARLPSVGDGAALEAGDALLVLTTDAFVAKHARDSAFALLAPVASYKQRRHRYAPLLGTASLVLMIVLSQVLNEPQYGSISILKTALCGMMFMAVTGCASQVEMRCVTHRDTRAPRALAPASARDCTRPPTRAPTHTHIHTYTLAHTHTRILVLSIKLRSHSSKHAVPRTPARRRARAHKHALPPLSHLRPAPHLHLDRQVLGTGGRVTAGRGPRSTCSS